MNYNILVITSHDQVFLDRLSEQTICLREQRLDYFDGTPTSMQTVEAEERVHKEKVVSAIDKKREHVSQLSTRVKLITD
jgi:ATP-binding cassette subfamily F protein 3